MSSFDWLQLIGQIAAIVLLGLTFRVIAKRSLRLLVNRVVVSRSDDSDSRDASRRKLRVDTLLELSDSLTSILVIGITSLLILDLIGINLAPLLAGAGVAGIAIGFGAQAFIRDLIAGISVLAEDQYGVGDVIDFGEGSGVVESMSLKSTRVRGLDGTLWHLPNGEIARVANKTQGWSRVILDIGVSYGSDLDRVIAEIKECLRTSIGTPLTNEKLIEEPEIWGVQNLGDSAVEIRIATKVKPGEQWQLGREMRLALKNHFDRVGIEIPFPQLRVWNQ